MRDENDALKAEMKKWREWLWKKGETLEAYGRREVQVELDAARARLRKVTRMTDALQAKNAKRVAEIEAETGVPVEDYLGAKKPADCGCCPPVDPKPPAMSRSSPRTSPRTAKKAPRTSPRTAKKAPPSEPRSGLDALSPR